MLPEPPPPELGAVLFDMDGTVVDTEGLWRRACAAVAAELGLRPGEVDPEHVHGRPAEHTAAHLQRPGVPLGWISERLTGEFARLIALGVTPLPGALALLDGLASAGVPTALVTASSRRIVEPVLRTVGAERFRLVVAAEDAPRGKPAPDPYLLAAAGLGLDPAVCVAVEDSPVGLASALAAGCRAVAVAGARAVPYGVLSVNSLEKIDVTLLRRLVAGEISIG
ncbi:HAD family phosphatase [Streptosporangium sp. NPDC000239]|uniref:HAD family hydrolase n=1 Tax=Streptosporangium jomthongense TaxID=1193683 RepID=A0ABV8EQG0_9ACTN